MRRPNLALATALSALVTQACGATVRDRDSGTTGPDRAGSSQSGTDGGGAGGVAIDVTPKGGSLSIDPSCDSAGLFADQVVLAVPVERVFYSWTTDEQVAELRSGGELFSRSERPGLGRGRLFDELVRYAEARSTPSQELASVLAERTFAKARFAWPNPWATLLGLPGESYGNQLLRIELRPEAWIAVFDSDGLSVFDGRGERVSDDDALATPERVGAIYYRAEAGQGERYCGTFLAGVAFREFALGNLAMVARWSLATPQIAERLERDVAELERFRIELGCRRLGGPAEWADSLTCKWLGSQVDPDSLQNYEMALGLPNQLYWPSDENLQALIAALEVSKPSGAPLAVEMGD